MNLFVRLGQLREKVLLRQTQLHLATAQYQGNHHRHHHLVARDKAIAQAQVVHLDKLVKDRAVIRVATTVCYQTVRTGALAVSKACTGLNSSALVHVLLARRHIMEKIYVKITQVTIQAAVHQQAAAQATALLFLRESHQDKAHQQDKLVDRPLKGKQQPQLGRKLSYVAVLIAVTLRATSAFTLAVSHGASRACLTTTGLSLSV